MTLFRNLTLAAALALGSAATLAGATAAHADEFWDRFHNQQERIHEGVQNGSLTPQEARRLEQQERQLQRERHRLADNGLSRRDREILNRDLDRESARIHDQRTDDDVNWRRHDRYADNHDRGRDRDHDWDDHGRRHGWNWWDRD